jgi:DNA-binding response OmpR family regulator
MNSRSNRLALVIDDEAPIRLLCRINLEAAGWDVEEAPDGLVGLEIAERLRPDVILLDVMMPGLDGWEVATRLLESDATNTTPIVFLTARAEARDRARGLESGGIDYVTKPFDPIALSDRLEEILARVASGEEIDLRREKLKEIEALLG